MHLHAAALTNYPTDTSSLGEVVLVMLMHLRGTALTNATIYISLS